MDMKSLLYKDLMNLKQQLRFYAIILVFYAVIGVRQGDMSFLGMVMAIFAVMLSVTAYAYDERAGWDKYALTMPFGIRELVWSKYVLAVGGVLLVAAVMIPVNIFSGILVREAFGLAASWIAMGLFITECILPVIFRFGVEKGRLMMFVILLLPAMLVLFLGQSVFQKIPPRMLENAIFLSPVLLLIFLPLSVWISYRMYKKKEL